MTFTAVHHITKQVEDIAFRRNKTVSTLFDVFWGEQKIGIASYDRRSRVWSATCTDPFEPWVVELPSVEGLASKHYVSGWLARKVGIWCDTRSGSEEFTLDPKTREQVSNCTHRQGDKP